MDGPFRPGYQRYRLVFHGLPFQCHQCGTPDGDASWEVKREGDLVIVENVPADFRDITVA